MEISHQYDDIIRLPHHVSTKHPQMSMLDRAAQFSPFAALIGYEDAIDEAARLTDQKIELSEDRITAISEALTGLEPGDAVDVVYFMKDVRKAGGSYITSAGTVRKVDAYAGSLLLEDGTTIPFDEIYSIEYRKHIESGHGG